jgi:hypothetical protein
MKYNKLDQHLLRSIHGDKYTETKVISQTKLTSIKITTPTVNNSGSIQVGLV